MFPLSRSRYGRRVELKKAGLGRRAIALSIDWLVALFTAGLFMPIFASDLEASAFRLGVFICEISILTALGGSSMGQRICGIRVLTWPDHLFVKPTKVLLRTILIALVIPPVVTDSDGRGLHDRLAGTVVVRIR